jgi:hypothetical protein
MDWDSSDNESEFEGFTAEDIEGTEIPDAGSDISVSPVSTPPTSDNESDFDEDTWSRNLRKPNVRDFNDRFGATFTLEDNQQEKDFFNKFFPRELIEKITTETNNYATKCIEEKPDPKWKPTNVTEILAFIGLHVVMSVIQLPSYTLCWKQMWPYTISGIPQVMQRERFERLCKYFHCNDTSNNPPRRTPGHDKLCHVRPVLDAVSKTCLDNYKPPKEQTIDEGMIAFKGRLSFKQYLPAKPTKFGIKVWKRASPYNGYCHEFQVYTGKKEGQGREDNLGSRVVKDLTRKITDKGHHVYMDNFFSNPTLFEELAKETIYCCGTARGNRKGMPETLKNAKLKNRGELITMQKGNLCAWVWKDKKNVFYLSTNCDPTTANTVRRRQKDGTLKDVPCPSVATAYNKFMFGVDRADQIRMQYSTCRKALKWWKYLFWFCFDLALVNSYICMKESPNHKLLSKSGKEKVRTQLSFRMALGQQLIGTYRGSRKRKLVSVVDNCGNAHWPTKFEKKGRCKLCYQNKRRREVKLGCKQCDIYLCVDDDCFAKYHSQLLQ